MRRYSFLLFDLAFATACEKSPDALPIEIGRCGDLIAVRGDPLEDISILSSVAVVIKSGKIVRPE